MAERADGAAAHTVMEDSLSEIEWARYKAAELAKLAERNAIVIVPIGSTEQHGPHLPTQVDARTDCIYTFISEFTVRHRVPLAGGTYWNIAQTEIAQILEKQKALLHACEAETSMMLALSRADRSRWAPSVRSRGSNRLDKVARPMVRRGLFLIHAVFRIL